MRPAGNIVCSSSDVVYRITVGPSHTGFGLGICMGDKGMALRTVRTRTFFLTRTSCTHSLNRKTYFVLLDHLK